MFENIYPSADNHVTGIVGLLAAAEALSKYKDDIINVNGTKDILFTFFQGVSIMIMVLTVYVINQCMLTKSIYNMIRCDVVMVILILDVAVIPLPHFINHYSI